MRKITLICALACATLALAASPRPALANVCQTDSGKTCATGMPIEGYCECNGQGGTVVNAAAPHMKPGQSMRPAPTPPPQ